MERYVGRMMRNMSLAKMVNFTSGMWTPAIDIYETEDAVLVYIDVSGVDPEKAGITVDPKAITVSGERRFPHKNLHNIHQMEIEYGYFQRTVSLPVPVDVANASSALKNGLLIVTLPKLKNKGSIKIKLS